MCSREISKLFVHNLVNTLSLQLIELIYFQPFFIITSVKVINSQNFSTKLLSIYSYICILESSVQSICSTRKGLYNVSKATTVDNRVCTIHMERRTMSNFHQKALRFMTRGLHKFFRNEPEFASKGTKIHNEVCITRPWPMQSRKDPQFA